MQPSLPNQSKREQIYLNNFFVLKIVTIIERTTRNSRFVVLLCYTLKSIYAKENTMENTQQIRNAKKLKSTAISHPHRSAASNAYKHFNSASNKRRKNRKKYFEHDTRTRNTAKRPALLATKTCSIVGSGAAAAPTKTTPSKMATAAPIKKIKFNNEINIYETRNGVNAAFDVGKCKATINKGQKKRANAGGGGGGNGGGGGAFHRRRNTGNGGGQSTTKRLQKQLIETQKRLQKQLNAMQQQNNSFLALIHSNCIRANAKYDDSEHTGAPASSLSAAAATGCAHIDRNSAIGKGLSKSTTQMHHSHSNSNSQANLTKIARLNAATHTSTHCSEPILYTFCTDQSKCSVDIMANGNKATAIR